MDTVPQQGGSGGWFVKGLMVNLVLVGIGAGMAWSTTGIGDDPTPKAGIFAALIGIAWLVCVFKGGVGRGCGVRAQILLCVLLAGGSFGLVFMVGELKKEAARESLLVDRGLRAQLETYLHAGGELSDEDPYRRGKMVLVDPEGRDFDGLIFELPESLLPQSAAEVQTVVHIIRHAEIIGHYDDGTPGYQWHFIVQVHNLADGITFFERSFSGSEPPSYTESNASKIYGSVPTEKVLSFLAQMPEKR